MGGERRLAVRTPVGVLGVEHAEDVGVRVVFAVGQGLQGAGAAGGRGLRVAVAVVADDEGDLDLGAVDASVLGVGHRHLEGDRVAEVVDPAVGRQVQGDPGRGVSDRDEHGGRAGLARGVGHRERRRVLAVGGVGVRRIGLGGAASVTEVPGVAESVAVGVRTARGGERHRERCLARGQVRGCPGDRRVAAGDVLDAVQGGVLVTVEVAGAVVQDVQRAVRAEGHVHHLRAAPGEGVDGLHGAVASGLDALDPAASELTGEEVAVELLRELHLGRGGGVVAVDRTAHRGLRAAAELRYGAAVVGDPGGLHGRQVGQTRVAGRGVLRCGAVELRAGRTGGEVVVRVGVVLARAVRPAEVARPGDAVELDLTGRPARGTGGTGVRTVVTDVDDAGRLVDAHPKRIAEAHGVDLGAGPGRARREEVAARDGVRTVRADLDPQHLAAQVVGVPGRTLGVVGRVARGALVDRRVAVRRERIGVVPCRQVQVAGRVEVDVAADMAADAA
ncbi:hypothetical protein STENM223S_06949 [Streptomyces tendae]